MSENSSEAVELRGPIASQVVVGPNFCIVAEEADEGDFVLVHDGVSVSLKFPYPARVTPGGA
jgi:hydrogenase maturation factor